MSARSLTEEEIRWIKWILEHWDRRIADEVEREIKALPNPPSAEEIEILLREKINKHRSGTAPRAAGGCRFTSD